MEVILIGPIGTGKTTVAGLLSAKLGLERHSLDKLRWRYYEETDFDKEHAKQLLEAEGFWGVYAYWKRYEAYAVERVLAECRNCVIDFGAGHSVFEEPDLFDRVAEALAPYPNVVLLLPSADPSESLRILNERTAYYKYNASEVNEHFIAQGSNEKLAKIIVYTKDKLPEQTVDEIAALIQR